MKIQYRSVGYTTYTYKGASIIKYDKPKDDFPVVVTDSTSKYKQSFQTLVQAKNWINQGYPKV